MVAGVSGPMAVPLGSRAEGAPGAGVPRDRTQGTSIAGGLTQALGHLAFPHPTAFTGEDGGVGGLEAVHTAVTDAGAPAEVCSLHSSVLYLRRLTTRDSCGQRTDEIERAERLPGPSLTLRRSTL